MKVSATVPSPQRHKELEEITKKLFFGAGPNEKKKIQGELTDGKKGAWVYWTIPVDVEAIQLIGWSKETGNKSFKLQIEMLQGPNNIKQDFFLQCGGSTQPYHGVFQTPGSGWVIRMQNKKFLEDGLIQVCVLPYKTSNANDRELFQWNGIGAA